MATIDLTHAPYGDLAIISMKGTEEVAVARHTRRRIFCNSR